MRKSAWILACLAAGILGGCRDTLCAEIADAYAQVDQKARPCVARAPLPAFTAASCERQSEACDEQDRERLQAQLDCYARLETCVPDQRDAFLDAMARCDGAAPSNACEAALY